MTHSRRVTSEVKSIKVTMMSKKGRQFFSGENRGDTTELADGDDLAELDVNVPPFAMVSLSVST